MRKISKFALLILVLSLAACSDDEDSPTPPPVNDGQLVFSPGSLANGQVGQPYLAIITVSNNHTPIFDIAISNGSLPPGLTLSYQQLEEKVEISGTPGAGGTTSFTVTAKCFGTNDPGQTGDREYSLEVVE